MTCDIALISGRIKLVSTHRAGIIWDLVVSGVPDQCCVRVGKIIIGSDNSHFSFVIHWSVAAPGVVTLPRKLS